MIVDIGARCQQNVNGVGVIFTIRVSLIKNDSDPTSNPPIAHHAPMRNADGVDWDLLSEKCLIIVPAQ